MVGGALEVDEGDVVPARLGNRHLLHDRAEPLQDADLTTVRNGRVAAGPRLQARGGGQHHLIGRLPRRDTRAFLVHDSGSRLLLANHVGITAAVRHGRILERSVQQQIARRRGSAQRLDRAARRRRAQVRATRPGDEERPLRRHRRALRERDRHRARAALRERGIGHEAHHDGVGRTRRGRGQVAGEHDASGADERRAVARERDRGGAHRVLHLHERAVGKHSVSAVLPRDGIVPGVKPVRVERIPPRAARAVPHERLGLRRQCHAASDSHRRQKNDHSPHHTISSMALIIPKFRGLCYKTEAEPLGIGSARQQGFEAIGAGISPASERVYASLTHQ